MSSPADGLFAFRRALFESGDRAARLARCLADGKALFESKPLAALLDGLLAGRARARAALGEVLRVDHFGMLLAPGDKTLMSAAAAAGGFPLAHAAFPSALFTRELGRLLERRRVPTSIFKAHGRAANGNAMAVEVFFPEVDDAQAEAWMARGVGNHVALTLSDARAFTAAVRGLRDDGVRVSSFMYDEALYLPNEEVSIVYFDLEDGDAPLRLELRVAGDVTGRG